MSLLPDVQHLNMPTQQHSKWPAVQCVSYWSTDLELLTLHLTTAPTLFCHLSISDSRHLSSLGCLGLLYDKELDYSSKSNKILYNTCADSALAGIHTEPTSTLHNCYSEKKPGNVHLAQKTPPLQTPKSKNWSTKFRSIGDVEKTYLETSLSLASEVGSALLTENKELKENLIQLTNKNIKLKKEIKEWESTKDNALLYQQQLEEIEEERECILSKYNSLVEEINNLENMLIQEKQLRKDLEVMFEEHDKENNEAILRHETIIKQLQQNSKEDV
ncbi:hypothetical protein J6590_022999 [Homalodisca vitripennis]|nr:hypothetical protein J6590_022999 [Homalodisca vitripennis]